MSGESKPLLQKEEVGEDFMPVAVGEGRRQSLRSHVFDMVEGDIHSWSEYLLLCLICANVISLAISTMVVEEGCIGSACLRVGDMGSPYADGFELFETFTVCVFSVEYIVRLWACVEIEAIAAKGPVWGRVAYATTFFLLIDFASIAPYWFFAITGDESPEFTTAFRVFRLIRLLKADQYLHAFALLEDVVSENSALLAASSFYAVLVWVLSAAALFLVESDNDDEATAVMYQSIPKALYPTLLMLTGNVPEAVYSLTGRIIVGMVAVAGVAIFVVPSALLASGFMSAALKNRPNRHFPVE